LRVLGGEGSGDDKKDKGVVLPALEEGANGKKLIESNHSLINYFVPNSSSKYHFIHIYYRLKPMRIQENILINMRLQGQERWSVLNYRNNFFFFFYLINWRLQRLVVH